MSNSHTTHTTGTATPANLASATGHTAKTDNTAGAVNPHAVDAGSVTDQVKAAVNDSTVHNAPLIQQNHEANPSTPTNK